MRANGLKIEDSDSEDEPEEEDEEEDEGTGVMTSQLRHFVIQVSFVILIYRIQAHGKEYIPRPMLFDITQTPNDPESAISGYKVCSLSFAPSGISQRERRH